MAEFHDGVLTVHLPKASSQTQPMETKVHDAEEWWWCAS